MYVVTEAVVPLITFLEEEDGRNTNLVAWGIHQIAVRFCHCCCCCCRICEDIWKLSFFSKAKRSKYKNLKKKNSA